MAINEEKLNEFMMKAVGDLGAVLSAGGMVLGLKFGLYKILAEAGGLTSSELAERAQLAERYVREWLAAQAASGYINYDADTKRFSLSEEQAFALASDEGPNFPGAFLLAVSMLKSEAKMVDAYRTGAGVGWHEHDADLFRGTELFFRPSYAANLVSSWIPALEGVEEKLQRGAKVADVGCGHGASTILMAKAYPNSTFFGFDYHEASIQNARKNADAAGVADRVTFETASAKDFPAKNYDLVAFFDCLHDMGDPVGAAAHVRETLDADGSWMIVEPFADDKLENNLNPIGRIYYSASTFLCTPASLSQEVGLALGAQAGEARLREVATQGGFTRFRRAAETPFNLVLEARP
jgi:2-polyprenyl-3-methyl-5-hydroxy-6-metoxy-1,4-benzoquinol methylase